MKTLNNHNEYYTPIQMKFPVDLEKIIEISDPIYTFNEIMEQIDLYKYFAGKGSKTGRPRFDSVKLLKIILFAFMENGYASLRNIEKLCKTDIRFIWLLDDLKAPSYSTVSNFMNEMLIDSIEDIFNDIYSYIFKEEGVDLIHVYIDGTKLEANANKYTWVWKKSCITSRERIYMYLTQLIQEINTTDLFFHNAKIGTSKEYTIEYVEYILSQYKKIMQVDISSFVYGSDKRKTVEQKHYEKLEEYPIADAGYGSYNNYLFCEQKCMKKYMKFTMFKKETTDKKYRENEFRAINFKRDAEGNLICPNGKKFQYLYDRAVKGNKYGRTEEFYQCEDCSNCLFADKCKKGDGNRTVRMNEELTEIHKEVLDNLTSTHGLLLRANRSIQAEGTYGIIKWDRQYKRIRRRGLKYVIFEFTSICIGFNLYKYHLKKQKGLLAA